MVTDEDPGQAPGAELIVIQAFLTRSTMASTEDLARSACECALRLSGAGAAAIYLGLPGRPEKLVASAGLGLPDVAERAGGRPEMSANLSFSTPAGASGRLALHFTGRVSDTVATDPALGVLLCSLALALDNRVLGVKATLNEAEAVLLAEVVRLLDATPEPLQALPQVVRRAAEITGHWYAIAIWDGQDELPGLLAASPIGPDMDNLKPAFAAIRSTGQATGVRRCGEDEPVNPIHALLAERGMNETLLAPLSARGSVFGALAVGCPAAPDEQEVNLAAALAERIAVAVDTARLFRLIERGKREWETTFDTLADGISIHDLQFNVVRANRAFAALVGLTPREVVGRKCFALFHCAAAPCEDCPAIAAIYGLPSGSRVIHEANLGDVWLSANVYPLRDREGEMVAFVHILRDITEERKLQETVVRTERLRALGEMATGVAHEFGNLLSSIGGWSEVLIDGDFDDRVRRPAAAIYQGVQDAAEAVRRIQDYARVRRDVAHAPVDLARIVEDALELARPRWRDVGLRKSITFDVVTDLKPVPPVVGNAAELREVLLNIAFNAIDAMPRGGTLSFSTFATEGQVGIRVTDSGVGMSDELRKRIFDPFFTTKGAGGSGLGLAISYGVIERHGGQITVDSQIGGGSTFTVLLPASRPGLAGKEAAEDRGTLLGNLR